MNRRETRGDVADSGNSSGEPVAFAALTAEERRVLQECRRESFYFRSLPIGTAAVVITNFLIQKGTLAAHPKFGSIPKSLGVFFAGYIVGKLSYTRQCQLKLMQLENSPLAERLRQQVASKGSLLDHPGRVVHKPKEEEPQESMLPRRQRRDFQDIDTDRSQIRGLDDSQRPSLDSSENNHRTEEQQKRSYTTYEELRRANRAASKPQTPAERQPRSIPQSSPLPTEGKKTVRRNQYGDIIED